jgi:hypothetical protein
MLEFAPFLISALAFGVTSMLVFLTSTVILTIPVFATRGRAQIGWFLVVGFLLTVEAAVLVVLTILVGKDKFL